MTTQEVANKLVGFCRQGQNLEAIKELYHQNIVSLESPGAPVERLEGLEAVIGKSEQWASSLEEVHSMNVSDPVVAGDHFSVSMAYDATFKEAGRQQMQEVCVYEVQDGKIVKEQFFYNMPSQ